MEGHLRSRAYYRRYGEHARRDAGGMWRGRCWNTRKSAGCADRQIAKVYSQDGVGWYAATVIIRKSRLTEAVNRLRQAGGKSVTVSDLNYVFNSTCDAEERLTGN